MKILSNGAIIPPFSIQLSSQTRTFLPRPFKNRDGNFISPSVSSLTPHAFFAVYTEWMWEETDAKNKLNLAVIENWRESLILKNTLLRSHYPLDSASCKKQVGLLSQWPLFTNPQLQFIYVANTIFFLSP